MNKHPHNTTALSTVSPAYMLFTLAMLSGILMTISAHSWFSMWMGLELNLFGFIPIIMATSSNQEKEAACKYFLAQATPSAIFLVCIVLAPQFQPSSTLLALAVLMKLGAAPCHQWFPSVMNGMAWPQSWALVTVQKIAPFFLLVQTTNSATNLLMLAAALSSLTGGIGGMNHTLLRPIIAYSSIGHMGWMIAAMLVSNNTATLYLLSYIMIVSTTILVITLLKLTSINLSSPIIKHPAMLLILTISFMNMGGLPPLFGFFIKATVMSVLTHSTLIILLPPLILGSVMNLYYYLKVVFMNSLETPAQHVILKQLSQPTQFTLPILFSLSVASATAALSLF
uniref:NADH-ubiquinone oxidoreductase chain 2 n=1 Tax=Paralvinella sulfincola TaxID=644278 RepID=G8XXM3_9ANNE|nr:NADH dehydrogenase subunit 2 [Paralvinella sulfincola]